MKIFDGMIRKDLDFNFNQTCCKGQSLKDIPTKIVCTFKCLFPTFFLPFISPSPCPHTHTQCTLSRKVCLPLLTCTSPPKETVQKATFTVHQSFSQRNNYFCQYINVTFIVNYQESNLNRKSKHRNYSR